MENKAHWFAQGANDVFNHLGIASVHLLGEKERRPTIPACQP